MSLNFYCGLGAGAPGAAVGTLTTRTADLRLKDCTWNLTRSPSLRSSRTTSGVGVGGGRRTEMYVGGRARRWRGATHAPGMHPEASRVSVVGWQWSWGGVVSTICCIVT